MEAVKQHMAAGTDVNAKIEDAGTPLDYAEGETADLLRKHSGHFPNDSGLRKHPKLCKTG